ncbi:MAG: isochorismate synthase [Chlorobiaceae bacterium]|nr:isochorismate synthase [Chlorobiaceae bacterium]
MTEAHKNIPADDRPHPIDIALPLLKERVREAIGLDEGAAGALGPALRTFSVPVRMPDALAWLSRQKLFPKLYWMNREKSEWVAGIGEADRIELGSTGPNDRSFLLLEQAMQEKNPHARYIGGFCFNNLQQQNRLWEGFSPSMFILPQVTLEGSQTEAALTCTLWTKPGEGLDTATRRLLDVLDSVDPSCHPAADAELPGLVKTAYSPDREQWLDCCRQVLRTFESGEMEKVILARQTELEFSGPVPAIRFLMNYPFPETSTYRFYFEPIEGHAFFSFTPERLYRRNGDRLLTEALAGTVTKEALKADDHTASELLLNSEKDVREHRFVKDTIHRELQPVCSDIDMEETVQVLQLSQLAHLYTRCKARLKPECCNDSTVLRQLHPTPAVGGVPREASMRLIATLEPFCRGWYAGPIGWLSRDAAEFAVGIRSALVNDDRVYLYSGAGLVRGSDPDSEWEEVDQKIGEILAITRPAT